MIVFDLRCGNAHVFEAWFGASADYEDQRNRKLISCPVCGDTHIEKALSPVNVGAKSNQKISLPAKRGPEQPQVVAHGDTPDMPTPEQMKAMMRAMAELQAKVEASHEDVGDKFVEEVRAMHHGEIDKRPILGDASIADAVELHEEGIDVLPLPFKRKRQRLSS
jgi:hypothetical protein